MDLYEPIGFVDSQTMVAAVVLFEASVALVGSELCQ